MANKFIKSFNFGGEDNYFPLPFKFENKLGKKWKTIEGLPGTIQTAKYVNNMWVASVSMNGLWYSIDGINWTQCNCNKNAITFNTIEYGNGIWAAGCFSGICYSTDGINWTECNYFYNDIEIIKFANNMFIAHGDCESFIAEEGAGPYYSTDGISWAKTYSISEYPSDIEYGNGVWVIATDSSLFYSEDGETWNLCTFSNYTSYQYLCYENNIWVATSRRRGVYYSTDGINWVISNLTNDGSTIYRNICYADNVWNIASDSGLYYSTNGTSWTKCDNTEFEFTSVICSNEVRVATSNNGIYYSTDGISWTHCDITNGAYDYAVSGESFIITRDNNQNYYSDDGINGLVLKVVDGKWAAAEMIAQKPVTIINFTIVDCGDFSVESGTTWKDWIINDNIDWLVIRANTIEDIMGMKVVTNSGTIVLPDDEIMENHAYDFIW